MIGVVKAEECDLSKITIDSIDMISSTDGVEEINEASIDDKNIKLDIKMTNLQDSIKYKMVIRNNSNDDYEIDKSNFNISSDYIDYSVDDDGNGKIVKSNSSKTFYLTVSYAKQVPNSAFTNGVYRDSNTMVVNMAADDVSVPALEAVKAIVNPNTSIGGIFLIIVILLISLIVIGILKKKKYKYLALIILIISVPLVVNALCRCDFKVDANVQIEYLDSYFCMIVNDENDTPSILNKIPMRKGMSWQEYFDYAVTNKPEGFEYFVSDICAEDGSNCYLYGSEGYEANKDNDEFYKIYTLYYKDTTLGIYSDRSKIWEGIDSYINDGNWDNGNGYVGYGITTHMNDTIYEYDTKKCYCFGCG